MLGTVCVLCRNAPVQMCFCRPVDRHISSFMGTFLLLVHGSSVFTTRGFLSFDAFMVSQLLHIVYPWFLSGRALAVGYQRHIQDMAVLWR